jgi:hypothetical protein
MLLPFPRLLVALRLSVLVLATAVACAACAVAPSPSLARCTSFGVHAIRRHLIVATVPPACAGLSRAQVNAAVASAIRESVGPRPKAAARALAVRDSRYLERLVTAIAPGRPAPLPAPSSPSPAGPGPGLIAIACWLLTAGAGSYLLARARRFRPRPVRRGRGLAAAIMYLHASVAIACLGALAAFTATGFRSLGWTAVGLVITAAGLGMATLVTALPDPGMAPAAGATPAVAAARRQQSLVAVIVLHGILATVTILLVWLAAIGGS